MWKLVIGFTKSFQTTAEWVFDWTEEGDKGCAPIPQYVLSEERTALWDHSILNSQMASFNTTQNTVHNRIKEKCISYVQLPVFQQL